MSTAVRTGERERISPAALWAAIAAYLAVVISIAFTHEMWRDEVRAFSVATDAPTWGKLFAELHHEGHPILWYAVLRIGYALTHSPLVLPVAAIAIGAATAFLILRYAPFPVWLRLLAVFGAFLGYELSVVARNYGIGVLFMICACVAFRFRKEKPLYLGLSLALLANTSVHAALGALVLGCFWLTDAYDKDRRAAILAPLGLAAIALAVAGVAIGFMTASPTPDMAWARPLSSYNVRKILATIVMDPGAGLRGVGHANIAAAGELPWRIAGIDNYLASRILVDVCLAWLAWSLRRHWRALGYVVLTVIGFEILFRNVYSGALRHEGLILFLIFSICWMTVIRDRERDAEASSRGIAFGLLPLFALQAIALPSMAWRDFRYRESNSKAYGEFIDAHPEYATAILMSEPDYMMEPMPYYVKNPVYMPRQNEFAHRVYFDKGGKRQASMTLDQLIDRADSVSCAMKTPVLLAIGYAMLPFRPQGIAFPSYRGTAFTWNEAERRRLLDMQPEGKEVASFPSAVSDEIYRVYRVAPGCPAP